MFYKPSVYLLIAILEPTRTLLLPFPNLPRPAQTTAAKISLVSPTRPSVSSINPPILSSNLTYHPWPTRQSILGTQDLYLTISEFDRPAATQELTDQIILELRYIESHIKYKKETHYFLEWSDWVLIIVNNLDSYWFFQMDWREAAKVADTLIMLTGYFGGQEIRNGSLWLGQPRESPIKVASLIVSFHRT